MKRKVLAILAVLLGETLIVTLNVMFGKSLPTDTLVLNIVICSLIYATFCSVFLIDFDRSEDNEGGWVASLGINIIAICSYGGAALLALIIMNIFGVPFKYQLLVHGILLFGFIGMLFLASASSSQVGRVAAKEQQLVSGLDTMRSAARKLNDHAFLCKDMDPGLRAIVDDIQQNLRFLSPNGSFEARDIEEEFAQRVTDLLPAFRNYKMNEDSIAEQLSFLKHLIDNRKQIKN